MIAEVWRQSGGKGGFPSNLKQIYENKYNVHVFESWSFPVESWNALWRLIRYIVQSLVKRNCGYESSVVLMLKSFS
jgi:hypothetical protein